MYFCDICDLAATYYVANPGSNHQHFCNDHFPKYLKVSMPFVTPLTGDHTKVKEEHVVEEAPVVEEVPVVEEPVIEVPEDVRAVPETPAPKTRKKAAAAPVEEPASE